MTLYDYLMLKEQVQTAILVIKGEHVANLDNGGTYYMLYSLDTIFVELEFEKWTNRLVGRSIFKSGNQLEKYLPDFQVSI